MEYMCYHCGKSIEPEDISKRIRCPYCGGKVLFKKRPETIRKVKSR